MTFKSMDEFLKYYYPNRKEKIGKMTPKEFGECLARKHLERLEIHYDSNPVEVRIGEINE